MPHGYASTGPNRVSMPLAITRTISPKLSLKAFKVIRRQSNSLASSGEADQQEAMNGVGTLSF